LREFVVTIREALTQGLRPTRETYGHQQFLEECYNVVPEATGLTAYVPPTDPFNGGMQTNWPWPQAFLLQTDSILLEEQSLSTLNVSSVPWTVSAQATSGSIPSGGGAWHIADFGESWFAFKGNCTVFKTGVHRATGGAAKYYANSSVPIQTGTNYKGRCVIGGFQSGSFWPSEFTSIFSDWQQDAADGNTTYQFDDIGRNWVAWSSVGEVEFPLWLFFPDSDIPYDIGPTKENLLRRMRRNELGFMPMPYPGKIQAIHQLGDRLIVYSDDGISVMESAQAEVAPFTFGAEKLARLSLLDRNGVAVGPGRHLFVSGQGKLWSLDQSLELEMLDYSEYLSSLAGTGINAWYNDQEEEFHFTNAISGFAFGATGLYEHRDHLTFALTKGGNWYGLSHSPATSEVQVVTNRTDMSLSARKRINNTHVAHRQGDLKARHLYTLDTTQASFSTLPFQPLNKEGVLHQRVSGLEFKVEVLGSLPQDGMIQGVSMRYNVEDKRAIRGIFQDAG